MVWARHDRRTASITFFLNTATRASRRDTGCRTTGESAAACCSRWTPRGASAGTNPAGAVELVLVEDADVPSLPADIISRLQDVLIN